MRVAEMPGNRIGDTAFDETIEGLSVFDDLTGVRLSGLVTTFW